MAVPLPEIVKSSLRGEFSEAILQNTLLEIGPPRLGAFVTYALMADKSWMAIGSSPWPGLIIIHPGYYNPRTATGLALIAHELCHQVQQRTIPDFSTLYSREENRRIMAGQEPRENAFERPCYEAEARIRQALMAKGMPARLLCLTPT